MKQMIRFGISGACGFLIDAGVLYALLALSIGPYLARVISFFCAVFVTWQFNRRFTFVSGRRESVWREWWRYLLAMAAGGACNYASYAITLSMLPKQSWAPLLALAVGSGIGMVINFISAKFWVFSAKV